MAEAKPTKKAKGLVNTKNLYFLPEAGVSVEADDAQEAVDKHQSKQVEAGDGK